MTARVPILVGVARCEKPEFVRFAAIGLGLVAALGVFPAAALGTGFVQDLRERAEQEFGQLPTPGSEVQNKKLVTLGRALFWDAGISASGNTSCASCHTVEDWGADRRRVSVRDSGEPTGRNAPTVFNATQQPKLRWLGDRRSAAHQAERSITGSLGNASAEDAIRRLIEAGYQDDFADAFPHADQAVSIENFGVALEAYEKTLITRAPFDRFIDGESAALTPQQKQGLQTFVQVGCANCHDGALLGGTSFQRFGVIENYWEATGTENPDEGLFERTQNPEDKYHFRVSMLRNIAKTGPYFHDGSVDNLSDAVDVMATVQLGIQLEENQRTDMVAFLESLTGEVPKNYSSPKATQDTALKQFGKMHQAIGQHEDQARVRLGELIHSPNFYGVGAVEGLQGEITIINSKPFVTKVNLEGEAVAMTSNLSDVEATLLVGAYIAEWTEVTASEDVSSDDFDSFVLESARTAEVDLDRPFIFQVEGEFIDVRLHVINGACPLHARLRKLELPEENRPFETESQRIEGKLVGVFAQNAVGNITHPGTKTHRHIVFPDESSQESRTAHVESSGIAKGTVIRFPKTRATSDQN